MLLISVTTMPIVTTGNKPLSDKQGNMNAITFMV